MCNSIKEIFVFDLDFTIWNAGDTFCSETNPPYLWKDRKLMDCSGRWMRLYPEVLKIFEMLKRQNKIIAIASRTLKPDWARQLIQLFMLDKFIDIIEIYPGGKNQHFKSINNQTKIPFNKMVFFDDEVRNIEDIRQLGVECVLIDNGINLEIINQYL
ncbi:MAG: magnesium-dependent phosphatase-1 [Prolixibacteraceae bacterium]|nr:magnesium-dependent phosphatase-1 [Prolixibacteraceae bacterium]